MLTQAEQVSIENILSVKDAVAEYTYLEAEPSSRNTQEQLFLDGAVWAPSYDYVKLRRFLRHGELLDGRSYTEMKAHALAAIEKLWEAKESGTLQATHAQMYIDFYEMRVRRLLLLKTAQEMAEPNYASLLPSLRHRFMRLNAALYGEIDSERWLRVMASERQRLLRIQLTGDQANDIQTTLADFFDTIPSTEPEAVLLDNTLRDTFQPFIATRYADILRVVPATGDSILYNATQCVNIMKNALAVGGFIGWNIILDPAKTSPSTDVIHKTISLPLDTARTANQLKRLILHEQEVHARRGVNAEQHSEFSLLLSGTAQYSAVEEGLGLFLEAMITPADDNQAINRARDRYITAGLALGVGSRVKRDARQTFEILWRLLAVRQSAVYGKVTDSILAKAQKQAYDHIENAFRGTDFCGRGVLYTKLKIYYEGFLQNITYMRSIAGNLEHFSEVFVGKYNHTDATERQFILDITQRRSVPTHSKKAMAQFKYESTTL